MSAVADAGRFGPLPTHGRFDYSPIHGRADYAWPGGARLAVYLGFNIEHFAYGAGMGARLGASFGEPDVLNYAWREYGNRVGAWRCLELFDALRLPAGVIANTAILDHCPELIDACVARGDELIAHGHTNAEHQAATMKPPSARCWSIARSVSPRAPAAVPPAGFRPGSPSRRLPAICWPKRATATR